MGKILIGISGKAEHGKTALATLGVLLAKECGLKSGIFPLAARLKVQARQLGWDGEKDEAGRQLLQELSAPVKHYFGENYYSQYLLNKILESDVDVAFVDDVRMMPEVNDFNGARDLFDKYILIRIVRPGHKSKLTEAQLNDRSETELDTYDKFDAVIINDGTLEDLKNKLRQCLKLA